MSKDIDIQNWPVVHKEVIYQLKFASGQVYIGRSSKMLQRYKQHMSKMKYGYHCKRIQRAYDLFGEPEIGVIHYVTDEEYGPETEANYIAGSGTRSLNVAHANTLEQYFLSEANFTILPRFMSNHEREEILAGGFE